MTSEAASAEAPLTIVHVMRAAVGGLFRHVRDLAEEQSRHGHQVSVICDALTGGDHETALLDDLRTTVTGQVIRLPMPRGVGLGDWRAARAVFAALAPLKPQVIHGHGAKGGAYARAAARRLGRDGALACLYTPHGGSLHFDAHGFKGRLYFKAERRMERATDALIHVSAYEAAMYREKVGVPQCRVAIIPNGLRPEEFEPVMPDAESRDIIFVGAFRDLKGVDVLLEALALLRSRGGAAPTAALVGQAEGREAYVAMAERLGLLDRVSFYDAMPARMAFRLGRVLVVPSRAESMPYIVLEGIAAGLPLLATRVGGIPEIVPAEVADLLPPGDAPALADALAATLANMRSAQIAAWDRREAIRARFSIAAMEQAITALYRDILATKAARRAA